MASDALFVVKTGKIRILVKEADGTDREVSTLGPGEALGQLALLQTAGTRVVTAVSAENAEVVEIRSRDFQKLQAQKPQACLKLMMAISAQLGRLLSQNRELLRAAVKPKAAPKSAAKT